MLICDRCGKAEGVRTYTGLTQHEVGKAEPYPVTKPLFNDVDLCVHCHDSLVETCKEFVKPLPEEASRA